MAGGWLAAHVRAAFGSGTTLVGASTRPEHSQVRFRASADAAPTTPALPITTPGAPTPTGSLEVLGTEALLLWDFVRTEPGVTDLTDHAWRWQKHDAQLLPLGGSAYAGFDNAGAWFKQAPVGVGTGSATPNLSLGNHQDVVVDPGSAPVWCIAVSFASDGPVTTSGIPPTTLSTASVAPFPPALTPQPIFGDIYTNSIILYIEYTGAWTGVPGAWSLAVTSRLVLAVGGSGGPTTIAYVPNFTSGIAIIEFNGNNNTVSLANGSGGSPGFPPGVISSTAGSAGWPGNTPRVFGASNMGPYYWSSWRQFNGHILGVAIVPGSATITTALLNANSVIPGTGPIVASGIKFRPSPTGMPGSGSVSSRLSEYTHYWPLDDPKPGPMVDLLAGSLLTVVNPSLATFQVDGVSNPLISPGHTKGIHLGQSGSFYTGTNAYLYWNPATGGPEPFMGTGKLSDDVSLTCWIKWEGPATANAIAMTIFESGRVPYSTVTETALSAEIWPSAEPFEVQFQTWDSVAHGFETLRTPTFDWPAVDSLVVAGHPVPIDFKLPEWALFAVVLRTDGGMQMEIWVDGVLVASQAGSNNGWGANVPLQYVARKLAPCSLQHLTLWPFALSQDELEGIANTAT